jgi:hypothetical protein
MTLRTNAQKVQAFAGALYGVQLGTTYMSYVNADITSTGGLTNALNGYYNSSFGAVTNADVAKTVVKNLGITGTTAVADAEAYIQAQLNAAAPAARGEVIANILDLFAGGASDATYGAFVTAWNAKVEAAAAYKGADNMAMGSGVNYTLSVSQDVLMGSAVADMFTARVAQNANGEQTNQLATGDAINGGDGTDSLSAKVIAASPLNAGPQMAITPETVDLENVAFTALTNGTLTTMQNGQVVSAETVEINAKFMNGLDKISSVHSDASLLVTNVNTLTDSGLYSEKRLTEALTVRMDHSGNDAVISASNMTVLIDNDYLLRQDPTKSASLTVALTPQIEAAGYDATAPLKNNPYDTLTIKVDGVSKTINIATGDPATPVQSTYAALEAAIKAGLTAAGLSDVVVTRNVGAFVYSARDGAARSADTFTLSKPGSVLESQGAGSWAAEAGLPDDNSFGAIVRPGDASSTAPQITVQVELEKVGRGSDGGGLIIGGMATDGFNEWDFSSNPTLAEGVEKFNVKVSGDETQFSSLAYLHSTNNTLQTVVVTSATGSKADLIIGNHNTAPSGMGMINYAMKDVRDFDSTAFANKVTLHASLTPEVVAKYMSLTDTAAPAADNVTFKYNLGSGNDTLNLVVDTANLAAAGTTTREDFVLAIDGGAGNDKITVDLTGDTEEDGTEAWYANSKINANLSIAGGAGNDTVYAKGAGDWKINTGAGDDTVYSDNSGDKAVWVFNTFDQTAGTPTPPARNLDDLISSSNSSYQLYKGTVEVIFRGLAAKAEIESSTTTYTSTDLQINQAIKKAINSDAVLSKLIKATDGPANTLVVTSLIDGGRVVGDLAVAFAKPTTLTAAEIGAIAGVYRVTADLASVQGAMATAFGDYAAALANTIPVVNGVPQSAVLTDGENSAQVTDSTHTLGAGNDVLVLSTDADLTIGAASNETVVYNAVDFGNDVIVNFEAGTGAGSDKLNFTALGGKGSAFNAAINTDGLIMVVPTTTTANTAAAVKTALATADDTTASKGIYIVFDTANVGTVYQFVDGTAASDIAVTKMGSIDLADTSWSTLTLNNFA